MKRFALVLVIGTAAAWAQRSPGDVLQAIIAANNAADLKKVEQLYADDAVWLPPRGPSVEGKTAILARYQRSFATVKLHYTLVETEQHGWGDWAFSRGTTEGTATPITGGEPRKIHDKYLMILRREHGIWKIARLMWSPVNEEN
jgi:uncharacterized protein (TIGR02246 family)